jgi:hypothetical protein
MRALARFDGCASSLIRGMVCQMRKLRLFELTLSEAAVSASTFDLCIGYCVGSSMVCLSNAALCSFVGGGSIGVFVH